MKVDNLNLQTLFGKQTRYEIPAFQRPYIWNRTRQLEPLWDDVRNTAERHLEALQGSIAPSQVPNHFLGAVVLQQQSTMTADGLDRRIVVDGQQRLTTLQLLVDAVQEVLERRGHVGAGRLSLLVLNDAVYYRQDPDNAFKVWPTTGDQDAFRHAMRNDLTGDEYENSRIVKAHEYFKLQVQQWIDAYPDEDRSRAVDALERAVATKLEMVVIDLETTDDPHIIFETLNARGTPLLQSDLIKNMVLYEITKAGIAKDAEAAAQQYWAFADDNWWRSETGSGRNARQHIEGCLNHWLTMRTQSEVAPSNLFSEFRRYAAGKSIASVAEDIGKIGGIYRSLEEAAQPDLKTFLYRRGVMQAGVLTPVLLWLLSSEVPQGQLQTSLTVLESYLIRRMVCRMSTRGYVNLFVRLVGALEEAGSTNAGKTIVEYLQNQRGDAGQWPEDWQLEAAFVSSPIYGLLTQGRLRIVLEGIEGELRTGKSESTEVPRGLTIEHIMPQSWRQHWPLPTDVGDEVDATNARNRVIHSIGNLTLVNDRLNPSLSNGPWSQKQEGIKDHSVLFLNKDLLDEVPEVWDEAAIAERAKRLCQVAAKVWPYADKIKA